LILWRKKKCWDYGLIMHKFGQRDVKLVCMAIG
jgi:hypothetical protein